MKNFLQIASNAAVLPLMLAIHRMEKSNKIWKEDTYLRDYPQGPFGDTEE